MADGTVGCPDDARPCATECTPGARPEPRALCDLRPLDFWGTNPKYLFMREIGGPDCLAIFLLQVIAFGEGGPHWGGTLIIDEPVDLKLPLRIPPNFTLAGTGIRATSSLNVPNDLDGPAITFEPGGNQVLRDLTIQSTGAQLVFNLAGLAEMLDRPVAIRIVDPGPVYIESVHVFGLSAGISATDAHAIHVSNCIFDNNFINVHLQGRCRHWRIRDTEIRSGWVWGLKIISTLAVGTVDVLVQGCRFESNGGFPILFFGDPRRGALLAENCFGVFIFGNRFEQNPVGKPEIQNCLEVGSPTATDPNGEAVRFMGNLISADQPRPGEYNAEPWMELPNDTVKSSPALTQTHIGFNTSVDWGTQQPQPPFVPFPLQRVNAPTE